MALTKITANIIEDGAISTASLANTSITADKLAATLDLTGKTITVATATAGDNDTTVASTAFVSTAIANLADSAPETLNTLNELAAALGDDANFSTTVTNSIALKAPLASPTFTGTLTASGLVYPTSDGTNGQVLTTDGAGTLSFSTVSETTINNNADNRIITGSGTANTLNGESGLTYDGSTLDVTGTVISDGLTVDGTGTFNNNVGVVVSAATPSIRITETDRTDENTQLIQAGGTFRIRTASDDYNTTTERMRIDHSTGDISFYEDTGTTAKFFWDASAEKLGIGTTNPSQSLEVVDSDNYKGIHIRGSNAPCLTFAQNVSTTPIWRAGISGYDGSAFAIATGASVGDVLHIKNNGNVGIGTYSPGYKLTVNGSFSKSSGSFRIDHPLEAKSTTHDLVHSFVEAPQADNIYRGKVDLVNGSATVNIDTVAGMTEGTFVALNREVQCFTTNESNWDAVKGSVSGNILTIESQNSESTATISWLVIGERQDPHMYDTEWTDDDGKVIVEPLKEIETLENA